ncbi:hypothetical protein GLOIN_2v301749 [Rhizophagus irregularis DAOM 181602=DAOM 197198]|uniref:Uncharacterized protein n=1 Tax=Rhizophagus irregularis (strain DAOM 181602 / DAOM 197198 / MUCL 43194) TaxID=747089 RepID=A0A2P4PPS0_RHIID|nr:hypothetical protein GLOIN_2v301749 [Rhizophagus irregularis DAOM 181602=DAOM 197198]POG67376.1 hypothetical protein GLOIN_2v301749 [Rhizophagus irregularis DAOM 181602=DAOM 197198]|eukprot:XP_025174242.1 hypothetical protein GLOIN_2v301749 [Rhizophagus irregularis DAOM 181602=DAOM 197198]
MNILSINNLYKFCISLFCINFNVRNLFKRINLNFINPKIQIFFFHLFINCKIK